MTLKEQLKVLSGDKRVQIWRRSANLVNGFVGLTDEDVLAKEELTGDEEVEDLGCYMEYTHKNWRQLGFRAPIERETLPDMELADVETRIYFVIKVK